MKIVIAPDSFKESLSAIEVARAIASGVREAAPGADIDLCPMADGGEGTVEAMVAATDGEFRTVEVAGPLCKPTEARFGLLGDGKTGVIEMAQAAGLGLIAPEDRNPLLTTTFGVGQLILAALDAGAERLIIGIGGSATTDGGAGCAQALGVVFIDRHGKACVCGLAGDGLTDIARIDISDRDSRIADCEILVACDVTNPLTGPDGAAAVYGPQKGATPEMVRALDAGLVNLADIIHEQLGMDVEHIPGAGAAGGLGAGLVAFAGAQLRSGIEIVADAVGLAERIAEADLVITGEGRFDFQSASGKATAGVAKIAADADVPCICIPGQADTDAPREMFLAVRPLVGEGADLADAMREPARLLKLRTADAIRNTRL
ncbi:MAG: glycerate kinase [Planctomycetota bacterium]|nr:glycerate kinase [Planctomycetota bacterium]